LTNQAKDSAQPGARKYLLTIPTYLRIWGAWDR
jgi:hypothetical protein